MGAESQQSRSNEKLERIHKARRKILFRRVFVVAVVLLIVIGGVSLMVYYNKQQAALVPGESFTVDPVHGRDHIGLKDQAPIPYSSNPPSSGPHYSAPANWGIYDYEVHERILIHNLEHGGVWISYRPTVPPGVITDLKSIVDEFGGSKWVMAPRSANDADVALVAWGHVYKFNTAGANLNDTEQGAIKRFYKAYKNRGPEFVPDYGGGIDPKGVQ